MQASMSLQIRARLGTTAQVDTSVVQNRRAPGNVEWSATRLALVSRFPDSCKYRCRWICSCPLPWKRDSVNPGHLWLQEDTTSGSLSPSPLSDDQPLSARRRAAQGHSRPSSAERAFARLNLLDSSNKTEQSAGGKRGRPNQSARGKIGRRMPNLIATRSHYDYQRVEISVSGKQQKKEQERQEREAHRLLYHSA